MTTQKADKISIKTVKGYWDRRPCNLRHSQSPVGSKRYFDEVEKRKYFVEYHIPDFAQFDRWKGKKVLEIGCGIGTDTMNFARAGAQVTAVDLSTESLKLAKTRAEVFGLSDRISFHQANAERLEEVIPVKAYDLVYSFGVIHHTPHPDRAVKSLSKFMNSRSELRMMVYAANSWKNFMIEEGYDQPEAQSGCPVAFTYTQDQIREQLLSNFKISSISQAHIFPYQIEQYVKYQYVRHPWFETMPPEMFKILEERLGWHMLVVAKKRK